MACSETILKLGTRGSRLAIAQSGQVAASLSMRWPGVRIDTVVIKTTGDRLAGPLVDAGGKGLFVKELELALIEGAVDFAVHSYKDVPVTMPLVDDSSLIIAAVPRRADARDMLVTTGGLQLSSLPKGARIGTGSLRRRCQLLEFNPSFRIEPIRGNIDTRLKKLEAGELDAVVLAAAGVHRAGLFDADRMGPIPVDALLPAPGQGALALPVPGRRPAHHRAASRRERSDHRQLRPGRARAGTKAERRLPFPDRRLRPVPGPQQPLPLSRRRRRPRRGAACAAG